MSDKFDWSKEPDPLSDIKELQKRIETDIGWSEEQERQMRSVGELVKHWRHLCDGEGTCPCQYCQNQAKAS